MTHRRRRPVRRNGPLPEGAVRVSDTASMRDGDGIPGVGIVHHGVLTTYHVTDHTERLELCLSGLDLSPRALVAARTVRATM